MRKSTGSGSGFRVTYVREALVLTEDRLTSVVCVVVTDVAYFSCQCRDCDIALMRRLNNTTTPIDRALRIFMITILVINLYKNTALFAKLVLRYDANSSF